jgi:hypothetical protein
MRRKVKKKSVKRKVGKKRRSDRPLRDKRR